MYIRTAILVLERVACFLAKKKSLPACEYFIMRKKRLSMHIIFKKSMSTYSPDWRLEVWTYLRTYFSTYVKHKYEYILPAKKVRVHTFNMMNEYAYILFWEEACHLFIHAYSVFKKCKYCTYILSLIWKTLSFTSWFGTHILYHSR